MKSRAAAFLVTLLVAQAAMAGSASSKAGTTSVAFLKFPVGARALGMGEAGTSTAKGAEALFWNPANLGSERTIDIILNHQPMLEFMNYDVGAAAFSQGSFSTGLGFARLTHKDLDVLDLSGTKVGTAQAYDQQIALGAAFSRKRWGAGLAIKYIQSKLDDVSASAIGGDVGVKFPGFLPRINHAITVQNLGSTISYDSESYSLPMVIRGGTNLALGKAIFAVDAVKPADGKLYLATGAELPVFSTPGTRFKLRAGYRTQQNNLGDLAGLSIGSGIEIRSFRLDYAWRPNGDFGDSHNISLGYSFSVHPVINRHGKPIYKKNNSGRYRLPEMPKK